MAADLPPEVPTLTDLYKAVGVDYDLSVDIKTPDAIDATVNAVRAASEQTGQDIVASDLALPS